MKTKLTINNGAARIVTADRNCEQLIASFHIRDLQAVLVEPRYGDFGSSKVFIKRSRTVTLVIRGHPFVINWRDEDAQDGNHSAYNAASLLDVFIRENAISG